MFGFLINVSSRIWLLLNDLVQPFFEFISTSFSDYISSSDLPGWVVSLLEFLVPDFLSTAPIDWFFSSMIIIFIVVSVVKYFTGVIRG